MRNQWGRRILQVGVVVFSLGLLAGYVWYEQNRVGDGGWTVKLDEELVEDVSFSSDEKWLEPGNATVLMPSSKNISMPIFRKGDSRLDFFEEGSENSSKEDSPRTLMPSSKSAVFAIPGIKIVDLDDWTEISGSNSESTLDAQTLNGAEIDQSILNPGRIKWMLPLPTSNTFENPAEKSINDKRLPLMGSTKSGAVWIAPYRLEEDPFVGEKLERALMPSSKSRAIFVPLRKEKEKPAPEKRPKTIMRSTKSFPLFKEYEKPVPNVKF